MNHRPKVSIVLGCVALLAAGCDPDALDFGQACEFDRPSVSASSDSPGVVEHSESGECRSSICLQVYSQRYCSVQCEATPDCPFGGAVCLPITATRSYCVLPPIPEGPEPWTPPDTWVPGDAGDASSDTSTPWDAPDAPDPGPRPDANPDAPEASGGPDSSDVAPDAGADTGPDELDVILGPDSTDAAPTDNVDAAALPDAAPDTDDADVGPDPNDAAATDSEDTAPLSDAESDPTDVPATDADGAGGGCSDADEECQP